MANYTYTEGSIPTNLVTGDTITFRDNTVMTFVNDYYNWWKITTPPSTINANTVQPTNTYPSNVFSTLEASINYLRTLANQNGKCQLQVNFSNYIDGYSHPHTDITVSFLRTDYWTNSMSKTIFYEDPTNTNMNIVQELITFAEGKMRDSYCYKIASSCCLDYECNPDLYYKI